MADLTAKTEAWARAFAAPMPDGIDALLSLAEDDVRFVDPFNDVQGHAALREILLDMVERCDDPSFDVIDVAASDRCGYIRWAFSFRPKGTSKPWQFAGMTELHFGPSGLVSAHLDHWDSGTQLYARLPLLGWIFRLVRSRLSVTPPPQ